jgi:hypothetical protein
MTTRFEKISMPVLSPLLKRQTLPRGVHQDIGLRDRNKKHFFKPIGINEVSIKYFFEAHLSQNVTVPS